MKLVFPACFYLNNFYVAIPSLLGELMELLTQNWNLSKKLRIPAISRLQKMHNVDIASEIP